MYKDDKYIGSAGKIVDAIFDQNGNRIERLSDISPDWEINLKCPDCHRAHTVDKETVDKPIKCPCGKTLYALVPEHLR